MSYPQQIVYPQEIINQLSGVDFRILDEIDYLTRAKLKRKPRSAPYCYPSRRYLAQKLKVSIRTISRHISKLVSLGILKRTQRWRKGGRWQTNLYTINKLGKWLAKRMHRWIRDRVKQRSTVSHSCPTEPPSQRVYSGNGAGGPDGRHKTTVKPPSETGRKTLEELLANLK